MLRSMITAANTMNQLQQQLDVISNNIANSNTTGFKRRETNFGELLVQQFDNLPDDKATRQTPAGVRRGVGAKLAETNLVVKQGPLQQTGRMLDVALTKEGQFFRVLAETADGKTAIRYTRDGSFYLSPSANDPTALMLVTSDGFPVLSSTNEPITIQEGFKDIAITDTGTLRAIAPDGRVMQTADLGITNIVRPQLLQSVGDNLYALPNVNNVPEADVAVNMTGTLRPQINVQQGALEQSNVDLGTEMTDLMLTQRAYQMNAKSISISDQMMGLINGVRS
ncbi:flagellar basal-body rod protein FlgG [Anoxybacillus voinovskiensis]|uniref:Flagellar basal-body rod protein FlgG n=1 Tax=Anoxybacteroides voinovskiense TaxID=230470 RepID=A0A840DS75_9BACL|nr:flagellar hook-basal body protein [Anoxybacillus voinovskiensis]MBB4072908.1 flagellar basal-body rod protein FlgG [Anoxybacillus voinovskiensis]GGJ74536.1 flagellar hook-basal body complex protein FlhP [Anoxybacillus voinovskiensis]